MQFRLSRFLIRFLIFMKEIINCWLPEKRKRTCLILYGWNRFLYFWVSKWQIFARRFLQCNLVGYYLITKLLWVLIVVDFLSCYNDEVSHQNFKFLLYSLADFYSKMYNKSIFIKKYYFIKICKYMYTSKYNVIY